MAGSRPTLEEWRPLYQAAMRIKEIAPWQWMQEDEVFGVQNPETGELGFVSVMGTLGEHLALAVYLGSEGLYGFWAFRQIANSAPPEAMLGLLQIQASFEDREILNPKDRDIIKELGLKFRGRQAWPMFRSYRPGFVPWFLEPAEARFLRYALEQAADVTLRLQENDALFDTGAENNYLVRAPRQEADGLVWEDRVMTVPPPEPQTISIPMDIGVLKEVKQLPCNGCVLEVDFFNILSPIQDQDNRPYFPHLLLAVDSQSGMVLANELMAPEPDLMAMWGEIPVKMVYLFARMGGVPGRINVREPVVAQLLRLLAQDLGFEVKVTRRLRQLEQAKEFLLRRFQ